MPVRKKSEEYIPEKRSWFHLSHETKRAVWGIVFFGAAAFVILNFFNLTGRAGNFFYRMMISGFGWGYYILPLVFFVISLILLFREIPDSPSRKKKRGIFFQTFFGALLFLLTVLGTFQLFGQNFQGGWAGYVFAYPFLYFFGFWASLVFFITGFLISLLITLNVSPGRLWRPREAEPLAVSSAERREAQEPPSGDERAGASGGQNAPAPPEESFPPAGSDSIEEASNIQPSSKGLMRAFIAKIFTAPPVFELKKIEQEGADEEVLLAEQKAPAAAGAGFKKRTIASANEEETGAEEMLFGASTSYAPPPLSLLDGEHGRPSSGDIRANANIIKRTLEHFGVDVEMGEVNVGPTVTQYTLKPAQGIKLSRLVALQNDLALALAAHPLRIEAPIPGKSLVGIEIPNKTATLVRLRNLIDAEAFNEAPSPLTFVLGRDVSGIAVYADLGRMPHLLIAGSTGSGKSVCIHDIIISFLYRNSPNIFRLILVDPKRVELSIYNGIPHLLTPVITEGRKAINALRWAVGEMERRFEILEAAGARDIVSYHSKTGAQGDGGGGMSYIVIIIDELADLIAAYPREVEGAVVRLAQMARAVGIHLIVSTQRPSVEVITGLIKANITSRIAFQVASQIDSRTILDMAGAEKLLGSGDMLFLSGDALKPRRIQGSYVTEQEIKRIVDHLKMRETAFEEAGESGESERDKLSEALSGNSSEVELELNHDYEADADDELYPQAKELVISAGKASASLLQRRLRVGYSRAARLLDRMEEEGLIGPADGAKPREIL